MLHILADITIVHRSYLKIILILATYISSERIVEQMKSTLTTLTLVYRRTSHTNPVFTALEKSDYHLYMQTE